MFAYLSDKSPAQCVEWVEFNESADDRMIKVELDPNIEMRVARLKKNDVTTLGYEYINESRCVAATLERTVSTTGGYTCERLRISDDCTAFWVPYKAGKTLPARAVTGGTMTNGDIMYVAKFWRRGNWFSGFYTVEIQTAYSTFERIRFSSKVMKLLIIL